MKLYFPKIAITLQTSIPVAANSPEEAIAYLREAPSENGNRWHQSLEITDLLGDGAELAVVELVEQTDPKAIGMDADDLCWGPCPEYHPQQIATAWAGIDEDAEWSAIPSDLEDRDEDAYYAMTEAIEKKIQDAHDRYNAALKSGIDEKSIFRVNSDPAG